MLKKLRRWLGSDAAATELPEAATAPGTKPPALELAGSSPSSSAAGPAAARRISIPELRRLLPDAGELAKGTQIADRGQLRRLARFRQRIFAEAAGSGQQPYRVSVELAESGARPRCSCPAARSRPFCKHAAALLVTWARSPEAFAQSDEPPFAPAPGGRARKTVKKGKRGAEELMADGIAQVQALVRELASAGVATVTRERIAQIRQLGTGLREYRLRRLSARCLALADLLGSVHEGLDDERYSGILADLLLTAVKVRKHLGGEPLDARYVEELIGKSWRKADRQEVAGLQLVEYAFRSETTPDGFVIRESRFADAATGEHYAEKQILPAALARRTPPKPSYGGDVLADLTAEQYPGFPPRRLHLPERLDRRPLETAELEALAARASPIATVLGSFLEHRRDVFAPPALPVTAAAETIAAVDGRLLVVDGEGHGLHLEASSQLEEQLAQGLRGVELRALLGDLEAVGALPRLQLHAVIVERGETRELLRLGAPAVSPFEVAAAPRPWLEVAREAGLSPAAISLGEIRQELARALTTGLGAFAERTAEPLAVRLDELRLGKLAALVRQVATGEAGEARVSSFVKAQQLLDTALLRLASTVRVETDRLSPIPGSDSLRIREPATPLVPSEVAAERAAGRLSIYEAAWHSSRHYRQIGPERLAEDLANWADGAARPYLLSALVEHPRLALAAARRVLEVPCGCAAQATAIELLQRIGGGEAEKLLLELLPKGEQAVIRPLFLAALAALQGNNARGRVASHLRRLSALDASAGQLLEAGDKEERRKAAALLGALGSREALGALRRACFEDRTTTVRKEAAHALARLGDVEMTTPWMKQLAAPRSEGGRIALVALGRLADIRAFPAVLASYVGGGRPQLSVDALLGFGVLAVGPLLDFAGERPDLSGREALRGLLSALPVKTVQAAALERLEKWFAADAFPTRAKGLLKILRRCKAQEKQVAQWILARTVDDRRKGIKPLRSSAAKAVAG